MKALVSNPSLLADTLNENFAKIKSDARRITASGEGLSWEKAVLEKELDETFYQKINAVNFDFLDDFEKSTEEKLQETNGQNLTCNRLFA